MSKKEKILLHVCCAPCSTSVVERLIGQGYEVILFFSNSNISPEDEYLKRLAEARKLLPEMLESSLQSVANAALLVS
jgi:predicted adenine nucleotide alpha hydrolase (AANH) superfamily ATPase